MKEYFIVDKEGRPRGAFSVQELRYRHIQPTTLVWHEGWSDWQTMEAASVQLPELQTTIGEPVEDEDEFSSSSPFGIDWLYNRIHQWIDQLLARHHHQTESHFFYRWLARRRNYYLALPSHKEKAKRLWRVSWILWVFISFFFSMEWGWFAVYAWLVSQALREAPYAYTQLVIFAATIADRLLFYLPKRLRHWLMKPRLMQPVTVLVLTHFIGWHIALIYALYQLFVYVTGMQLSSFITFSSLKEQSLSVLSFIKNLKLWKPQNH